MGTLWWEEVADESGTTLGATGGVVLLPIEAVWFREEGSFIPSAFGFR